MARLRIPGLLALLLCVAGAGQSGSAAPLATATRQTALQMAARQKGKHPQNWKNCKSKVVRVGGAQGWVGDVAQTWTQPKIYAGDKLLFVWDPAQSGESVHFVSQFLTAKQYKECDFTGARELGPNNVTMHMKKSGTYYFGCPVAGHCLTYDMKITITVLPPKQCPVSVPGWQRRRQTLDTLRGRSQ